ncbi:hypothetical protein B0O80DRAFT_127290 [Mortierella sp. GBAus27b]|nr:hypothetical protein BGX31_001905 [Mortierella sp. GBA43]KAI8350814.1 hypothetical protein B0O80DRAFT_127290 [Mortierella sp. GBAus27b]
MSGTLFQVFRARSSANTITIPTRHDPKTRRQVVRWKDVLQYFKDAQGVANDGVAVLFLTDDDLEDLIPLRIAHHPGVVLEVISTDDIQGGFVHVHPSRSTLSIESGLAPRDNQLVTIATHSETSPMASDVVALRRVDTDTDQALVARSHGISSEILVQELPTLGTDHFQSWTRDSMNQQEQIRQLQERIEEVHATVQQTQEQTRLSQQQIQDKVDTVLEDLQHMDQRTLLSQQQLQERNEDVVQIKRQLDEQRQRLDNALQEIQEASRQTQKQAELSQQQIQVQIDKILQDLQHVDQRTLHSEQQMKQQLDQQRRHLDTSLQEIRQKTQHSQQGIRDSDTITEQLHSSSDKGLQEIAQVFYRLTLLQTTLATPYKDLPIPRLFIVLPAQTGALDRQGTPYPIHFRLYFLCECGTHTMTKNCTKTHEVHLADHPGYEVINYKVFFKDYGSYLLAMTYMVKCGINSSGLLVRPLLGLHHANKVDTNQHHLSFVQQNISRLINETIAHLEEAIGTFDTAMETTSLDALSASEFRQIRGYLKIKGTESLTGGLGKKISQGQCAWICSDHMSIGIQLRQLKNIIDISGGRCINGKVKVKMTSNTLTNQFKDILVELSKSQEPTGGLITCLNGIETLSIDFGRLSMTVLGVSRGKVEAVAFKITHLSNLMFDDLAFIQQWEPFRLKIKSTPQKVDENNLVLILRQNQTITDLHIRCHGVRVFAVIKLVISTRRNLLQSGYQPALETFEVVDDGSTPCKISINDDDEGLTRSTVQFTKEATRFDMTSHIKLGPFVTGDKDIVSNFFHQYGWSIRTLIIPDSFCDADALVLTTTALGRISESATIHLAPTRLTSYGLDIIDQAFNRTQGPLPIRLFLDSLHKEHQLQKALLLLKRYKGRLKGLRLNGIFRKEWLPRIAQVFSARSQFLQLQEFVIDGYQGSHAEDIDVNSLNEFTDCTLQWIASMISAPPPFVTPLRILGLFNVMLYPVNWKTTMKAMDLSALELISFKGCSFFERELMSLSERLADSRSLRRRLDLNNCWFMSYDGRAQTEMLVAKAPQVEIVEKPLSGKS